MSLLFPYQRRLSNSSDAPSNSSDTPTGVIENKGGDSALPVSQVANSTRAELEQMYRDVESQHKKISRGLKRMNPKQSVREASEEEDASSEDLFRSSRFDLQPPNYSATRNAQVPVVAAEQVEDPSVLRDKEEKKSRQRDRYFLFGTVMVAVLVNAFLIAAVLLTGLCLLADDSSCFRGSSESSSSVQVPSASISISTNVPKSPPTPLPSNMQTLPPSYKPYPTVPVDVPVVVAGEISYPLQPLSPPSISPLALVESTSPTPLPRVSCPGRFSSVDCRTSDDTSCTLTLQNPFVRQECSIDQPLRGLTFRYHPFDCNPHGTSQSQDGSNCRRILGSLSRNPVNITCQAVGGELLTVTPSSNLLPSTKLTVRSPAGALPQMMQCLIIDTMTRFQQQVNLDTSGKVTLSLGDLFGSLELVSCVIDDTGVTLSRLQQLNFSWTISNFGPNVLNQMPSIGASPQPSTADLSSEPRNVLLPLVILVSCIFVAVGLNLLLVLFCQRHRKNNQAQLHEQEQKEELNDDQSSNSTNDSDREN